MRDELKSNLAVVNEWLRFGEAKNAALIAFNGALSLGLFDKVLDQASMNIYLNWYIWCIICFSLSSLIIGIISFLPATRIKFHLSSQQTSKVDNLLFFGHISKYESQEYLKVFAKKIGNNSYQINEFDSDISNQLITNSKIALKKFNFFKVSVWVCLIGLLTPVGALVLHFLIDSEK